MAGKIKKLLENELVGGTQSSDVYPVTSVKAVYDEDNERLDNIIRRKSVVNISTNYNSDHVAEELTLEEAINKVPSSDRVPGFNGTFLSKDGWVFYQFSGEDISNWGQSSKWHKYALMSEIDNSININLLQGDSNVYNLSQAIDLVPIYRRSLGLKIRFRFSESSRDILEAVYIAADISDENWKNTSNWSVSTAQSEININYLFNSNQVYTLENAIDLVSHSQRHIGTVVLYRSSSSPLKFTRATYIAFSALDVDWKNTKNWSKIELSYDENINLKELSTGAPTNINLLENSTNQYTLEQAIALVPSTKRILGAKIKFRSSTNPQKWTEATYIAADVSDENWNNVDFWIKNDFSYPININSLLINSESYTLSEAIKLVPKSQRQLGTKIRFRSSTTPQKFTEATYIAADVSEDNWSNKNFWFTYEFGLIPRTRWFALGDSITQGFYSKDGKLIGITTYNYTYYVGIINNYEVTNYGVGGSGYVHNATVDDKLNAKDKVDTIDFSECDLATLAWGVNDWHYNCKIGDISSSTKGDGTMVGNMIYCIEKILTDNPKCKIVVILPQNASAFGGDIESNWGLGTSLETSGTLQNVIDAQISVCEYYGIQYIDQTKSGIVNRFNIKSLLPDGLHPAEDGYINMAKYISKQIQYA